jgi:hypothetical protein
MSCRGFLRLGLLAFTAALVVALSSDAALAQCALCKVSAAGAGSKGAQTLNLAILVLLIPPVTIFCSIFIVAYKYRQAKPKSS